MNYHIEIYGPRGAFLARLSYSDAVARMLAARPAAQAYLKPTDPNQRAAASWQFTRTEPTPTRPAVYRIGRVTARND